MKNTIFDAMNGTIKGLQTVAELLGVNPAAIEGYGDFYTHSYDDFVEHLIEFDAIYETFMWDKYEDFMLSESEVENEELCLGTPYNSCGSDLPF